MLEIVERELRVASRSRGVFIGRAVAAAVPLAILLYYHLVMRSLYGSMSGAGLFAALMYLALVSVCFGGLRATADAVTSEKREGTLGLLFLTDLTGTDVIAGKLAAYGLRSAYGVIAMLPMIALSLLLGGVTFTEFLCGCLLLLNSLFFSLSLGLMCSTLCKKQNVSLGTASAVMSGMMVGGFFVRMLLDWFGIHPADVVVHLLSPMVAFSKIAASFMGTDLRFFWIHAGCLHALGWVCLIISQRAVRECWKEVDTMTAKPLQGWRRWFQESPDSLAAYRRRVLHRSAYYWLVTRTRFQRVAPWASVVLAFLAFLTAWIVDTEVLLQGGLAIFIIVVLHLVYRILLAGGAARVMVEDRLTGGLELTLGTPMTVSELLRGYNRGVRRNFGGPFIAILLIDLTMVVVLRTLQENMDRELVTVLGCLMFTFVVDCLAIVPLTLWKVIDLQKPQHAAGTAGFRIIIVPALIYLPLAAMGVRDASSGVALWLAINLLNALISGADAAGKLSQHLRERVASRFTAKVPIA